jgi:hypothetical protein
MLEFFFHVFPYLFILYMYPVYDSSVKTLVIEKKFEIR